MILCSQTPSSIIKAALLAQILSDLPCLSGEQQELGLFMHTEAINADNCTISALIERLRQNCGLDADWLLTAPGKTLIHHIAGNMRYQSPDRSVVIFAAIEQALRYGHAYCLGGVGDISRIFITRTRTVWHEVHRMTGFIRFQPGPDNTLVTSPKLYHNTADIILRKIAVKYPNTGLVMVLPRNAIMIYNGVITPVALDDYLAYSKGDNFQKAWETYYNSQYIAARKNIALAQRVIPKKYWNWLSEGKILEQESQKML
ncbi:hypothetical protein SDC9_105161 [bioreactor metagenome]|uniref:DUF4130 domain-containing protein n=1 Tax=bioreactor metagenome TaxID=1076179 RepID=A0A645AYS8_9ZZZZ